MDRRPSSRTAAAPDPDAAEARSSAPAPGDPTPAAAGALGTLSDLPVAGLTRRRIALLIGALVAAWVIVLFARQVGEASEATARADRMRTANVQLEAQVTALEAELALIQKQDYIEQAARAYRLGTPHEIPFVLPDDAPPLPADAPGSAAARLGSVTVRATPLDSWSRLLFGPDAGRATGG